MQNPYNTEFSKAGDAAVSGSNTIYRMEGDTHYVTGGLGYRFNRNFYADLAVVYQTQKDQLYPFPTSIPITVTQEVICDRRLSFRPEEQVGKRTVNAGYKF